MCGQEGYYGTSSFSILLDMKKLATVKPKEKKEVQEIVFGKSACDTIQIHNNLGSIAETTKDKDVEYTIQLF
jgi:DNA helicase TIP49 (TBP-interacting protein)